MMAHLWPVLYFFSDSRDFTRADSGIFARYDELAGEVRGETGIPGLKLDFNAGLRLCVPAGDWHVCIQDADSEQCFLDMDVSEKILISMEQYFIRWQVDVFYEGEKIFSHVLEAEGQDVCFVLEGRVLGDSIMLLPYVRAFVQQNHCARGYVLADKMFHEILANYYPELQVVDQIPEDSYAAYHIGAFQTPPFLLPDNGRMIPAEYIGQELLGLSMRPDKVLYRATQPRKIMEPYVCISVQASGTRKGWLYPQGWEKIVGYLQEKGYRVLCIDRERLQENDGLRIIMPEGAEDLSGDYTLMDRVNMLAYADFFIGIASGLSWLAHAAGCPVVLISGITMPWSEFYTSYRVQNRQVCHGCYNDLSLDWRSKCPLHVGTTRELECSKRITPVMVRRTIDRLLGDLSGNRTGSVMDHEQL